VKTETAVALPQPSVCVGDENQRPVGLCRGLGIFHHFPDLSPDPPFLRQLHDRGGGLHICEFSGFFHRHLLSEILVDSMILGVATVITTSIIGHRHRVSPPAVRFSRPWAFSYLTIIPMIMPPWSRHGFRLLLGRAGTVNILCRTISVSQKPVTSCTDSTGSSWSERRCISFAHDAFPFVRRHGKDHLHLPGARAA